MTTVAVLVSVDDLTCAFGDFWTRSNLNEYIAFKMKPYLNLHVFSYYDFEKLLLPIDGRNDPVCLWRKINTLTEQQLSQIKLQKAELSDFSSLEELCECRAGMDLLELLAGKFNEKSIFYNTVTGSSYIDSTTIELIKISPEKYVLTEINLHK